MTWDILIPTIPHRHGKLCALLKYLDPQMQAAPEGVRVVVFRDNLERRYGAKCAATVAMSIADYVCFLDDDDMVPPNYVEVIWEALQSSPDYVGFPVRVLVNGDFRCYADHSLRHGRWTNEPELIRDFVHKNPIRRELMLMGSWGDHYSADGEWAESLRRRLLESGGLAELREVYIPDAMYIYQLDAHDNNSHHRDPLPADAIQPLPAYSWLTTHE